MSVLPRTRTLQLASALEEAVDRQSGRFEPHGARGYTLGFDNGTSVRIRATREGPWLVLRAAPGSTEAGADLERLVRWNADLDGVAKFALAPEDRLAHLRGEIPLDQQVDLPTLVAETCAGIRRGHALLAGLPPSRHRPDRLAAGTTERGRVDPERLAESCRQAGWSVNRQAEGRLTAEIQMAGSRARVLVDASENRVRVSSPLGRLVADDATCREAAALCLLATSDAVRFARTALPACGDGEVPAVEVCFAAAPGPELLARAVTALMVARDLCVREVEVLQTPRVAAALLRLRGRVASHQSASGSLE